MGDPDRQDLDFLRAAVGAMRELGVLSWNGIVLGPAPLLPIDVSAPKDERDANAAMRAYYENLLGHAVSDELLKRLP